MKAEDETWVWEGFRHIPLEGAGLYPQLCHYIEEQRLAELSGNTLEVGSGDGAMWEGPGRALLERLAQSADVWLTDADAALVRRLAASELCRIPRVYCKHADVRGLPFANGSFARALVVHVLHWCPEPGQVVAALAEVEGVLAPSGHALIVTVDERQHMKELYALLADAKARLQARGIAVAAEIPSVSPRVLPFCAGNAEMFLRERFHFIRRVELRYAHRLTDSPSARFSSAGEFLSAYVRTLPFIAAAQDDGTLPAELADEAGAVAEEIIARDGAFVMSRCDVVFDCSKRS